MKATTLLRQQHRKTISALKQLEKGRTGNARALLDTISDELAAHMAIEQEIFYPAVRGLDEDLILEAFEEHSLAEIALKRLRATSPDAEAFRPRVTALRELLEHHIDEEQDELFPTVEKKMQAKDLNSLGDRMKARFEAVVKQGFDGTVPEGTQQTSADQAKGNLEAPEGLDSYISQPAVH